MKRIIAVALPLARQLTSGLAAAEKNDVLSLVEGHVQAVDANTDNQFFNATEVARWLG